MKVGFVVFDRMTLLDFVGFYDPLARLRTMKLLPELAWNVCAMRDKVTDDRGLEVLADRAGQTLEGFDLLFVPGGFGTRALQHDAAFVDWLRTGAGASLGGDLLQALGTVALQALVHQRDDLVQRV